MVYVGLVKRWNWLSAFVTGVMYVFWTTGDMMQQIGLGTIASPTSWGYYLGGAVAKGVALAVAGGASGDAWSWVKEQASNGKREYLDPDFTKGYLIDTNPSYEIGNVTVYESNSTVAIAALMGTFYDILGDHIDNIVSASVQLHVNNTDTNSRKRDLLADANLSYSVVYNSSKYLHSAMMTVEGVAEAARDLYDYIHGVSSNGKRDGGSYVTYSVYGEDGRYDGIILDQPDTISAAFVNNALGTFSGQVQPCTSSPQCWWVANKGCLSYGDYPAPGIASAVVGEFYTNQWGGIDNQCDSG